MLSRMSNMSYTGYMKLSGPHFSQNLPEWARLKFSNPLLALSLPSLFGQTHSSPVIISQASWIPQDRKANVGLQTENIVHFCFMWTTE